MTERDPLHKTRLFVFLIENEVSRWKTTLFFSSSQADGDSQNSDLNCTAIYFCWFAYISNFLLICNPALFVKKNLRSFVSFRLTSGSPLSYFRLVFDRCKYLSNRTMSNASHSKEIGINFYINPRLLFQRKEEDATNTSSSH